MEYLAKGKRKAEKGVYKTGGIADTKYMNNADLTALLTADSTVFCRAIGQIAECVERTKSHYGCWQLTLAGRTFDLVRSEDRRYWEIWTQDGDEKLDNEIATISEAKRALTFQVRYIFSKEARLAAFDAANPEIDY